MMSSADTSTGWSKAAPVEAPLGLLAAILSLGLGGLFFGTGEFVSMSLLPSMAHSTNISIPAAGSYISAYAVGVVIGAPAIAIIGAKLPHKALLLCLLLLSAAGYAASAVAWNPMSMLVARFIAGLPHGAYYGVASIVAASLVDESKKASAVAYVMLGLAAANVIGVPAATGIGNALGWRYAFGLVGAGDVVTALAIAVCIPRHRASKNASPMKELGALKRTQVWLTLLTAAIGFGGMFAVYSYITPTLTKVTHLADTTVPWMLALWGLGMVCGNIAGGWLADRNLERTIYVTLVWNVVFLALFSVCASNAPLTMLMLFLIGNGFALVPALQTRLMNVSGDAQTLAASLNHSAFNASNALGAALGGASIAHGFGWQSTGIVGAALAAGGAAMMLLSSLHHHMRVK